MLKILFSIIPLIQFKGTYPLKYPDYDVDIYKVVWFGKTFEIEYKFYK